MERTGGAEVEAVSEADYWAGRVKSIRRFTVRDADVRAPYKPLLLLWMIGRVVAGQPAAVSFKSEHLNLSDQESAARIRSLVGALMRRPLRRYRLPAPKHIEWHTKNLFRHPAR